MQKIKEYLYSARWAIGEAEKGRENLLAYAKENVTNALDALSDNEPDRPNQSDMHKYEKPTIIKTDIRVRTQGNYRTSSGKAKGLVVHYTAGRFDKAKQDALNTLSYMSSQGLGCLVMDTDGIIYQAANQDLDEVAWHAGRSRFKGVTGLSRYCMGIEICNAGRLDSNNKAWFGQVIPEDQVRVSDFDKNIKAGRYHKYTEAQEKSLINLCLWLLNTNEKMDLDWIIGHDEIADYRGKTDPGGSLSMTMPALRKKLKEIMES